MGGSCSTHGRDEKCMQNLLENLKGRNHSEDLGEDGRKILEWITGKRDGKMWTELIWLKTVVSGGFL